MSTNKFKDAIKGAFKAAMIQGAFKVAMTQETIKTIIKKEKIDPEDEQVTNRDEFFNDSREILPDTAHNDAFQPVRVKIEPEEVIDQILSDVTQENDLIGTETATVKKESATTDETDLTETVQFKLEPEEVEENLSNDQKPDDGDDEGVIGSVCLEARSSTPPKEPPKSPEPPTVPFLGCDLCKLGYTRIQFLRIHFCRRAPAYRKGLVAAFKRETPGERTEHRCAICRRDYSTAPELILHVGGVHCRKKNIPHRCHVCEQNFRSAYWLQQHMHQHTAESRYQCDQCERKFRLKFEWQRHVRTHDKSKAAATTIGCEFCGKDFVHPNSLASHIRYRHSGHRKLPYECRFCEKAFADKAQFDVHRQTHFECDVCSRKFSRRESVRRHRLTHD